MVNVVTLMMVIMIEMTAMDSVNEVVVSLWRSWS